jgi:hypothetical protein
VRSSCERALCWVSVLGPVGKHEIPARGLCVRSAGEISAGQGKVCVWGLSMRALARVSLFGAMLCGGSL